MVRLLKLGHTYEQIFRGYFRPDSALSLHYSPVLDFNMSNYNSTTDYSNMACSSHTHVETNNMPPYSTTLDNNIDPCVTNETKATSHSSDSMTYTNLQSDSNDNILQHDIDTTSTDTLHTIDDSCEQTKTYKSTDTEIQDVDTSPVQVSEESDTTESHKTQPSIKKPPPGFENVQPVTNPQDNVLLKMLQYGTTYPATGLLSLATLGYPLHYANALPCAHAYNPSVLGGLGVYNSYLVGQYLQQEYYHTAVQQCHALEQAQRLAVMQQQQRQNTKYTRNRKSPSYTNTGYKHNQQLYK